MVEKIQERDMVWKLEKLGDLRPRGAHQHAPGWVPEQSGVCLCKESRV